MRASDAAAPELQNSSDRGFSSCHRWNDSLRANGWLDAAFGCSPGNDYGRVWNGTASTGIYGRRSERRAAQAYGNRDSVVDILPLDRQYRGGRDLRQPPGHELPSRFCEGSTARRAARGDDRLFESLTSVPNAPATGSDLQAIR